MKMMMNINSVHDVLNYEENTVQHQMKKYHKQKYYLTLCKYIDEKFIFLRN
jgi:transcriptional antiterminator